MTQNRRTRIPTARTTMWPTSWRSIPLSLHEQMSTVSFQQTVLQDRKLRNSLRNWILDAPPPPRGNYPRVVPREPVQIPYRSMDSDELPM